VLQIAHYRILNELRHRSRQPRLDSDPDGALVAEIPDREAGPAETASREERRGVVRAALAALPAAERDALGLAMLQDLTHEEVARELGLPLGTAKTRIRTGLRRLRTTLLPQAAALALIALLAVLYRGDHTRVARDERALPSSPRATRKNFRLAAAPGVPRRDARPLSRTSGHPARRRHVLGVPARARRRDLPGLGPARRDVDVARHHRRRGRSGSSSRARSSRRCPTQSR
jgi:hypothetical protein